jgi:hypothetical protein
LPSASVDLVHARTAYFFGPGCEPGIVEAERVLRPGGALTVVDLDGARSPYGRWLCADVPSYNPSEVEKFFAAQGFGCRRVDTLWRFDDRADLEAVLRIEFSARVAERAIAQTSGLIIRSAIACTSAASQRAYCYRGNRSPFAENWLTAPGTSSASRSAPTRPRLPPG